VLGRRLLTELAPTELALIDHRHGFTIFTATDIPAAKAVAAAARSRCCSCEPS